MLLYRVETWNGEKPIENQTEPTTDLEQAKRVARTVADLFPPSYSTEVTEWQGTLDHSTSTGRSFAAFA